MVKKGTPYKLIRLHPRTELYKFRDKGLIKYVNSKPVYTAKGLKYIRGK